MEQTSRPQIFMLWALIAWGATSCATVYDSPNGVTNNFESVELRRHVAELASDEYEGRGAGYPGELIAAEYIAKQFEDIGLRPIASSSRGWRRFLQTFDMQSLDGPVPWEIRQSQNVVGILPGENSEAGYIVIGGHYDGQGKLGQADLGKSITEGDTDYIIAEGDVIWNSAVDNAVSIASIIEIARVFAKIKSPLKRTVVFVAFGAEESALDGSTYFANNQIEKLGSVAAMLNLEKLVGDPDAELLYVSYGTSNIFPKITKTVVESTGIDLVPFYPGVIANTDHYAFIMSGIPAITIGTGSIENVHTQSDHADGLDYDLLAVRTKFVSAYLAELANIQDRITFEGDTTGRYGASGGPATADERSMRKFSGEHTFKISTIVNGSPAHAAGLMPGDLVVAVNGTPVPEQEFYQGLEDLFEEEALCIDRELTINRNGAIVTILLPEAC